MIDCKHGHTPRPAYNHPQTTNHQTSPPTHLQPRPLQPLQVQLVLQGLHARLQLPQVRLRALGALRELRLWRVVLKGGRG